jgi:hypothetical protein
MKRILLLCVLFGCTLASAQVLNVPYTVTYNCTSGFGPYPFAFSISDPTSMTVTLNGTLLPSTAYTVTPVNNDFLNGGNVTLASGYPCQSGWQIILTRSTQPTQLTQFYDNMPALPMITGSAVNKLTQIVQEIEGMTSPGTINSVTGTSNQINVSPGANPVVSLSSTIIFPGGITMGANIADFRLATSVYMPGGGTLTLGTANQNWGTLGTGVVVNTTTTGALAVIAAVGTKCYVYQGSSGKGCDTPSGAGNVTTGGMTTNYIPYASGSTAISSSFVGQFSGGTIGPDYLFFNDGGLGSPSGKAGLLWLGQYGPEGLLSSNQLFFSGATAYHLVTMGGGGEWQAATTSNTDVAVWPVVATQCTSGSGTCTAVQFSGFADVDDDGTACTPGDTVVASTTTAATIHDTGSTAPVEGVYTVGICIAGSSPDFILLTPNFTPNNSTYLTYSSPATGIARTTSSSQAVVSTELSGDVTTSGSNVTTVAKIAGVAVGTPTGTGNVAYSNSPTFVTPTLGVAGATSVTATGLLSGAKYATATNCQSSASPAVCGAAPAGMVVIAAAATTVVVDTTAVTANSEIFVQEDTSLGTALSVTCNTSNVTPTPYVSARTANTSFTITETGSVTTNPLCLTYRIIN